ncbi:hypothetical protein T7987_19195 (plasmid) [Sulfitobacter faviae]|uniref:Uncharacterized protein n=1 Tax=Sulfitobacter faviae TaxID=1775881 RepID=A0ABZ0V527_9RHOB|nr:hypothetical protein [Sulfitobacter faviae]WPZ23948.1 hypothetical protein T7987_19195 [Sulfitobacter faviae]
MKTIAISQAEPVERDQPTTVEELAEAIAAGGPHLDELQDETAANDITHEVMEILNDKELLNSFSRYDEADVDHYRVGNDICVHWRAAGLLKCGPAQEHAAEDVQSFRTYLAEMEDE